VPEKEPYSLEKEPYSPEKEPYSPEKEPYSLGGSSSGTNKSPVFLHT